MAFEKKGQGATHDIAVEALASVTKTDEPSVVANDIVRDTVPAEVHDLADELNRARERRGTEQARAMKGATDETIAENLAGLTPSVDGLAERRFATLQGNDRTKISEYDLAAWQAVDGQSNIRDCEFARVGTPEYFQAFNLPRDTTVQKLREFPGTYLVKDTDGALVEDGQCYILAIPKAMCTGEAVQKMLREKNDISATAWDERDKSIDALQETVDKGREEYRAMGRTEFAGAGWDRPYAFETDEDRAAAAREAREMGRPIEPQLSESQQEQLERFVDAAFKKRGMEQAGPNEKRKGKQFAMGMGFDGAGRAVR